MDRVTLTILLMNTLVGTPMVFLVISTVALVDTSLKSVKIIELILFVAYTGRNSRLTSQRLERGSVHLLILNLLLTR